MRNLVLAAWAVLSIADAAAAQTYYQQAQVMGDGAYGSSYTSNYNGNATTTRSSIPNDASDITATTSIYGGVLKGAATFTGKGVSQNAYERGFTEAQSSVNVTPNISGAVQDNILFDAHLHIGDAMSLANRAAAVDLADFSWVQPNGLAYPVFSITAMTSATLSLRDLTAGTPALYMGIQAQVTQDVRVVNNGQLSLRQQPGIATYRVYCDFGVTCNSINWSSATGASSGNTQTPPPPAGSYQAVSDFNFTNQNFAYTTSYVAGHVYSLTMDLQCSVNVQSKYSSMAGIESSCDAGHSLYWNGITNAPEGFSLLADNGQDYVYSSSSSPAPLVVETSDVPEPATWAMLVCGFGLIGGAMRRRRAALAIG